MMENGQKEQDMGMVYGKRLALIKKMEKLILILENGKKERQMAMACIHGVMGTNLKESGSNA